MRGALVIAALCLAACSSAAERNRTSQALLDLAAGPLLDAVGLGDDAAELEGVEFPTPPRAAFDAIDAPVISVKRGDLPTVYVKAEARNRDTVTYFDPGRRGLTLRGAAINGTVSFFYDLAALRAQRDDPIVHQTPLADWPERVTRTYQFHNRNQPDSSLTVVCSYGVPASAPIEIVERSYATTRVAETCANGALSFRNVYWLIAETGEIWRSRQWIGPRNEPVTIEIVQR